MTYLIDYLMFAAKALTIAFVLIAPLFVIGILLSGRRRQGGDTLEVRKLNDSLRDRQLAIESEILPPDQLKLRLKQNKKRQKAAASAAAPAKSRLFIIEFIGDIRARGVTALREEVTAVLSANIPW